MQQARIAPTTLMTNNWQMQVLGSNVRPLLTLTPIAAST
jgi:hypothetical protein